MPLPTLMDLLLWQNRSVFCFVHSNTSKTYPIKTTGVISLHMDQILLLSSSLKTSVRFILQSIIFRCNLLLIILIMRPFVYLNYSWRKTMFINSCLNVLTRPLLHKTYFLILYRSVVARFSNFSTSFVSGDSLFEMKIIGNSPGLHLVINLMQSIMLATTDLFASSISCHLFSYFLPVSYITISKWFPSR